MAEVIRNATVTINAGVSTEVASEKFGQQSQRAVIMITNLEPAGGNVMYLSFDEEAASGKGIVLQPQQVYNESMDAGYKPTNRRANIYCAVGSTVAVHERVLVRG